MSVLNCLKISAGMKYNVSVKLTDGRVRLILPVIPEHNLLMQMIALYNYDELKELFSLDPGNVCINFYINIIIYIE